jgi:hypothetical protein
LANRVLSYALVLLTTVSLTAQAQTGQLKTCRTIVLQRRTLQTNQRPLRIPGSLSREGKNEYRLTVSSDLRVEVRLTTRSQLRLDIYELKPPKKIKTKVSQWTADLKPNNEYALVVSNCYETVRGTYQIEITVQ